MSDGPSDLEPETLVRLGCIETLNRRNVEKAEQFYTDDLTYHRTGEDGLGLDALIKDAETWQTALPDLEADITETVVGNDCIAFEYRISGTHDGELVGVPATGNSVERRGIGVAEFDDGLIDEYHLVFDRFGLLQDLGAL